MSYYTIRLTNALAAQFPVAFIPMSQNLPTRLYPGRARVGKISTRLTCDQNVRVMPGVDWFWGLKFFRTLRDLQKWDPDVVIFQWWTGTVLHSYLAIAALVKLCGATVIVEFHEVLDTGEERIPLARAWVRLLGSIFFRLGDAFVIHSEADRAPVSERYRIGSRPCVVMLHGPNDHHARKSSSPKASGIVAREAPPDSINLLFFGLIRPYKGLEDLVRAFELLTAKEVDNYWLTVVGETWEGWHLPIDLITRSRYRERITLVNRFVPDDEVVEHFANADAVVLPYHRSSASSPASVTMSNGLPLIITAVGGLPAAVADYDGAILVPPHDPQSLCDAIRRLPQFCGRRYADPHSWERSVSYYARLFQQTIGRP